MERIIGLVFSGFAVKVYAAALAIWIASEVTPKAFLFVESINALQ